MKRLVVVFIIIIGIIFACFYSLRQVSDMREKVHTYVGAVFASIEKEDGGAVREGVSGLMTYWSEEHYFLVHFVNHTQVDEITRAVAKLGAYAANEEYGDLSAELNSIVWQINHIWEAERPKLRNVL